MFTQFLKLTLVIDENVGTLDIAVEEIPVVTVGEAFQELFHDTGVEILIEGDQTGIQKTWFDLTSYKYSSFLVQ